MKIWQRSVHIIRGTAILGSAPSSANIAPSKNIAAPESNRRRGSSDGTPLDRDISFYLSTNINDRRSVAGQQAFTKFTG